MQAEIRDLRDAAVALRREWEDPPARPGWDHVIVWFGSLALLGPRPTRGVGAFCSFVLISRTWAAAHRRHTRHVNEAIGLVAHLVAEDLEDRAATDDAVEELAAEVGRCRDSIGEIGEAVTGLEIIRGKGADADLIVTRDDVREYLDGCIGVWREQRDRAQSSADNIRGTGGDEGAWNERMREVERAEHYIDAFQSARVSLLGELLPLEVEVSRGELAMARHALSPYPYEDGDVLVLGPETFVTMPGKDVIAWRGENYYLDREPLRDGGPEFYIVRTPDEAERHVRYGDWPGGVETVPLHCSARSGVAHNVEQLRSLVTAGLTVSPVGQVGIRPVMGPLLRPPRERPVDEALADAEPIVFLPLNQALALKAAVLGDHIDNVALNDAVTRIAVHEDAEIERREPQSDEEAGPRTPSSGQGPAGSGPDR